MANDTLLAIPFFTFMGLILERSGMAEDLLDTIGQLFGPIRGGLAFAVIFVGALLAATTGVVAASVISMGLISLPIMLRYGDDKKLATGVIAASGTLASNPVAAFATPVISSNASAAAAKRETHTPLNFCPLILFIVILLSLVLRNPFDSMKRLLNLFKLQG